MKQIKKIQPATGKWEGALGLTAMLFIIFSMGATSAYATSQNTYTHRAQRWCQDYKSHNPGYKCENTERFRRCPSGLHEAYHTGPLGRGSKACISGNVAKKNTADYVLQCRGGGKMFARVPVNGNIEILGMKKSSMAASRRKPAAGECAFLDRPLSSAEPARLLFKEKHPPFSHVDISSSAIAAGFVNTPIASVLKAIRKGQLFYVHVRNDRGWLDIRRVGP